jgi:co-chaperonin GroES (HSP10)
MNISLLPGHVLLIVDPPLTESKGGILFPDVEKVYACTGYVLLHEPLGIVDEDLTKKRIIFRKWSTRDFEWNGTTLTVVHEQNVLAILEEETTP